jgi:hypothetical protein
MSPALYDRPAAYPIVVIGNNSMKPDEFLTAFGNQ